MPDPPFAVGIEDKIVLVIGRDVQPRGPGRRLCGAGQLLRLASRYISDKRDARAIPGTGKDKSRGVVKPRIMSWILHPIRPQCIFFAGSGWNIHALRRAVLLARNRQPFSVGRDAL